MINGIEYSWSSVVANIAGTVVTGITDINYSDKEEKTNNYGIGKKVVSRSYGKYEATGDITLYKSEVLALQKASGTGNICDIPPFPVTVTYIKEGGFTTDKLLFCEFLGNNIAVKEGDNGGIKVKLDLILSEIKWGNK